MRSLKGLPVLAALVVAVSGPLWQPALAATTAVSVVDDAFEPAEVTVVVGDVVEWRWNGDNPHSVRSFMFDSHPQCNVLNQEACASRGDEPFRWTANEIGSFSYFCGVHGQQMSGTVTVVASDPPASTEPTPPASETETTPPPTSEPTPEPTPEPTSPSPEPEPEPTSEPSASPSPTRTATTPNVPPPVRFTETEPPSEGEPVVASEEPSFEAFPEPVEPTVSESDDPADDEVALPVSERDGGVGGIIWRVVGSLTVIGTAVAFGRLVLFGPPWDPTPQ